VVLVLRNDAANRITHEEARHSGGAPGDGDSLLVTGVVRSIERAAWVLYPRAVGSPMSEELETYAVPGSVVVEARASAEVWEEEATDPPRHGWLIDIETPHRLSDR
jgi:hypothetical protein